MNLKQLKRQLKKKSPKAWEKSSKRWDIKMIPDVLDVVTLIGESINPRLTKFAKKGEYWFDNSEIEPRIWKLLEKARKLK